MSKTWTAIREYAMTTQLPGTTLAQWYRDVEPSEECANIIATALLPIVEEQAECLGAIHWVDDDFSKGTFAEYLAHPGAGAVPCLRAADCTGIWVGPPNPLALIRGDGERGWHSDHAGRDRRNVPLISLQDRSGIASRWSGRSWSAYERISVDPGRSAGGMRSKPS